MTFVPNLDSAKQSDLALKTEQLLFFRLAFAFVGLILCLIFWFFGYELFDYYSTSGTIALVLAYSCVGLTLLRTRTIERTRHLKIANAALIWLDVFVLSAIVHFTMGLKSDLYVLYLLPILLSSYTFDNKGTYLTAGLVSVSYIAVLVLGNLGSLPYLISPEEGSLSSLYTGKMWSKIFVKSFLLSSVAFIWARFVGYMSGVAKRGENELREQLEHNNRMVVEIQAQARREALINSINSALRSTLELDRILSTAADELARALSVFRCAIVCRLSREKEEVFVCEADLEGGSEREGEGAFQLRYFDAQICEHLLKSRSSYRTLPDGTIEKTFLFSEPANIPEFEPIKRRLEDKGYGSLVVQPIMYRDSSRGVILIAEIDPRRFWSPSELELVKSVAGQVAVAIEQASLIEELSQKNDDLVQKNLNLDTKNLELRHMQSQLIHHEKMASLGRLVAGIAHELNNPINFVYGNLPYLKEYVNDLKRLVESLDQLDKSKEIERLKEEVKYDFLITDLDNIIADLNEGADRIRHIIRNLRSFSRLDEAELKEASIPECIESTLKLLSQYYGRDKVELSRDYADVPPILCYPGQLNQVLMNLLTNAAQALEGLPEPRVVVKVEVKEDELLITVSDNGPGIKDEIQSKIFDPFYTTKPVGQGTGLGLSICHSIMERHGGRIELKSELGKGTSFRAILPILESPDDFGRFIKKSIYQVSD